MPVVRIVPKTPTTFHVFSRIAGRVFLLFPEFKDEIREFLGRIAGFCGVKVLTYTLMDNHFHLVVEVQGRCTANEKEILRRHLILYGNVKTRERAELWKHWKRTGHRELLKEDQQRLRNRMDNLSMFMKQFKQFCTQRYNTLSGRKGTLWEGTFHSVIVDPEELPFVCAYVDMNPVRANLANSPEEYPWCGFAEAMGRSHCIDPRLDFRRGLAEVYRVPADEVVGIELAIRHKTRFFCWKEVLDDLPAEIWDADNNLAKGANLPAYLFIRCRIGYLTRGCIIGSKRFIERKFKEYRSHFSSKRKTGARKIHGCSELADELYSLRDLRKEVVSYPRRP